MLCIVFTEYHFGQSFSLLLKNTVYWLTQKLNVNTNSSAQQILVMLLKPLLQVPILEEAGTHKSAETHAGTISVPRDLHSQDSRWNISISSLVQHFFEIVRKTDADWLIKFFSAHPTLSRSFRRRSSRPISWLSTEKLKQIQQTQICIGNKMYYNKKWTQKTKARFRRLLWPPAWKQNGSILEGVKVNMQTKHLCSVKINAMNRGTLLPWRPFGADSQINTTENPIPPQLPSAWVTTIIQQWMNWLLLAYLCFSQS